jgi:hypothetical protein
MGWKERSAMPMQIKLFTRALAGSPSGLVEIEQVINAWLAQYPAAIVTHAPGRAAAARSAASSS